MAVFPGFLSLLWSGRAQGSEGRAGLGGAVHRTLTLSPGAHNWPWIWRLLADVHRRLDANHGV